MEAGGTFLPLITHFLLHSKVFREVLPLKTANVKLPKATLVIHEANLAKHFPLSPALVVGSTNRPHAAYTWGNGGRSRNTIRHQSRISTTLNILVQVLTDKAVRILAVQLVAIVQVESN